VTRYASFLVAVRSPFGVYERDDGKSGEYRCLQYAIVYIDEADSRYSSLPVSSTSCKILTIAETGARTEKVCFSERLHERARA